jgi:peptide-methionine (S)-S-oxide reductase
MKTELATFGAGCFWHVESEFYKIKGVINTAVGYMGGKMENPRYEDVCTHQTGHSEVVQIEFDPKVVSYEDFLDIFFIMHDPTSLNKQGPDIGNQYRSVIFYHSPEQKKKAVEAKEKLGKSGKFDRPIVTEIRAATKFYPAEEYHQKYLMKNGMRGCFIK